MTHNHHREQNPATKQQFTGITNSVCGKLYNHTYIREMDTTFIRHLLSTVRVSIQRSFNDVTGSFATHSSSPTTTYICIHCVTLWRKLSLFQVSEILRLRVSTKLAIKQRASWINLQLLCTSCQWSLVHWPAAAAAVTACHLPSAPKYTTFLLPVHKDAKFCL